MTVTEPVFLSHTEIPAGTPLMVDVGGVDYTFSSRFVGCRDNWLVIDYDPAMEAFDDMIHPGSVLGVRFHIGGVYLRFDAVLNRIILDRAKAVVLERPGAVRNIERRSLPRIPCDLPADMEVRKSLDVSVLNINHKGCRVRCPVGKGSPPAVESGDRIRLRIRFPGQKRGIFVEGEVRNATAGESGLEVGIRFDALPQVLQSAVDRLQQITSDGA